MAFTVFPSTNNVGGGKALSEANIRGYHNDQVVDNYRIWGLKPVASGDGLKITAGEAKVGGYRIHMDNGAVWSGVQIPANSTFYSGMKLTCDANGHVTAVALEIRMIADAQDKLLWQPEVDGTNTIHWLALSCVTTNSSRVPTVITPVLSWPRYGHAQGPLLEYASTINLSSVPANTDTKITGLIVPAQHRIVTARPAMLMARGQMCGITPTLGYLYLGFGDEYRWATSMDMYNGQHESTAVCWRAVQSAEGAGRYLQFTINADMPLKEGRLFLPRGLVRVTTTHDVQIAGSQYSRVAFSVTDFPDYYPVAAG